MATIDEILGVLSLLVDANLSFPPRDIEATAGVWARLLSDIPGATLEQAALDHIRTGSEFPKLATIRELAAKVRSNNNTSTSPDWGSQPQDLKEYGFCVVTRHGWRPWEPGAVRVVLFPPEVETRLAELEALDRLMTGEEMAEVEALKAGVLCSA